MPFYTVMNKHIESQVNYWGRQKQTIGIAEKKLRPFITISREYGCSGFELAANITEIINKPCTLGDKECEWAAYDKKILEKISDDMGISENLFGTLTADAKNNISKFVREAFNLEPSQYKVYKKFAETIRALVLNGNVIIVGRGGNFFSKDVEGGFHVRIVGSMEKKIERISTLKKISPKEAEKFILEKDMERDNFFKAYMKFDINSPTNYHLIINNSRFTIYEAAELIISGMKAKKLIV